MKIQKLMCKGAGILLAALLLSVGTSCQRDTDDSTGGSNIESVELEGNVSQFLGRGYNVFGKYIAPEQVKPNQIIDLDLAKKKLGFSKKKIEEIKYKTNIGSSLSTYQSELSASVKASFGIAKLFSASISESFSEQYTGENKYSYASVHTSVSKYTYDIKNVTEAGMPTLVECITPEFRASVKKFAGEADNFNPETLFNEYGTHVIVGATLGGRYDFYEVYNKVKASEVHKLGVKVTASFSDETGDANASASSGIDSKNVNTSEIQRQNIHTHIVGGGTFSGSLSKSGTYEAWKNTLENKETWTLIGFDDVANYSGVLPIWELISAMGADYHALAQKVSDGYVKYANEQNSKYAKAYEPWIDPNDTRPQYVWDVCTVATDGPWQDNRVIYRKVNIGSGEVDVAYYPIRFNLLEGTGKYEYIYVAYCRLDESSKTVTVIDSTGDEKTTTLKPIVDVELVPKFYLEKTRFEEFRILHPTIKDGGNYIKYIGFSRQDAGYTKAMFKDLYINVDYKSGNDFYTEMGLWRHESFKPYKCGGENSLAPYLNQPCLELWYIFKN